MVSCMKMGPFEELDVYINNVKNVSVEPCKGFIGGWRNKWLTCLRNLKRIARISILKEGGNPIGRKWVMDAWHSMRYSGNENKPCAFGESYRRWDHAGLDYEMRLCRTGLWPPTQFQGDRTSSEKTGSHLRDFI